MGGFVACDDAFAGAAAAADAKAPFGMPPSERQDLLRYMSAGTEFVVTFLLLLAGGLLLDRRLGSLPGFTVLGGAVGFGLALRRLLHTAGQIRRPGGGPDGRDDKGDGRRV